MIIHVMILSLLILNLRMFGWTLFLLTLGFKVVLQGGLIYVDHETCEYIKKRICVYEYKHFNSCCTWYLLEFHLRPLNISTLILCCAFAIHTSSLNTMEISHSLNSTFTSFFHKVCFYTHIDLIDVLLQFLSKIYVYYLFW